MRAPWEEHRRQSAKQRSPPKASLTIDPPTRSDVAQTLLPASILSMTSSGGRKRVW